MLDAAPADRLPPRITPPPRPLGPWAAFRAAQRNILALVPEAAYREAVVESVGAPRWKMVQDPEALELVLKTRAENYPRSDVTRRILSPSSGENLFVAEGRDWRWRRRAMAPGFAHRNLAALAPVISRAAEAASARLAGAAPGPVDAHQEMVTVTFEVIRDVMLDDGGALDREEIGDAVDRLVEEAGRLSLLDILNAPGWIPRPGRLFARGARDVDRMVEAIVRARLAQGPGETPDMLDMLIAAADPKSGRGMTALDVRNDLAAFIVAGHETTALALAWALWLLAWDPAVQARARDEAQAVLGDRAATADDLPNLPYVGQVIDETLRLYPPGGLMARQAREADDLLGHAVAPRETVMIPVYALHRHRALWSDPDVFDPDRFAPGRAEGRHRFAFLPFGAGPRICIGAGFAEMEARIVLATLLARFCFSLPEGPWPKPEMLITLRPVGGARLMIRRL